MDSFDCVLIFPPISVDERYSKSVGKVGGNLPPLGLAYIAGTLIRKGYSAKIIDCPSEEIGVEKLTDIVTGMKPKMIFFSSITSTFDRAVTAAKKLKANLENTPIILGGVHATIMKDKILDEESPFDAVVIGEGEITSLELARYYLDNSLALEEIKGICFKKSGNVITTSPREPVENLDTLPYPARDLLDMAEYQPLPNQYLRLPVVHMVAIRGCPYQCTYCSNNTVFGKKIRLRSPKGVVDEIKFVMEKYGAKEIAFWDDTLTIKKDWIGELCDRIINEGIDIVWSCYARVNTVDKDLLKKMKSAGCWNIFFGLESGSQELLDNIKKGITLEQIRNAISWTKEAGIETRGSFMLGLPGETPELARKTVDFAISLDLDYVQFCITTPYPGTELYANAEKYGTLNKTLSKYTIWEPVFVPKGYRDSEELKKVHTEAFRRFYLRPAYVLKRIRKIRTLTDFARDLKGLRLVLGFVKK